MTPGIIIGLTFHEFAHAFVADRLGDDTPRLQGRVTLNPMAHIDWMGLAALFFVGFGWGQPVQINPYHFKNRRRDEFLVSIAGVVMNLLLAVVFTFVVKILLVAGISWTTGGFGNSLWECLLYIIQINLVLMIFNLIPVPPLDGFNIVTEIFDLRKYDWWYTVYSYGNIILIALIAFNFTGRIMSPILNNLMGIIENVFLP